MTTQTVDQILENIYTSMKNDNDGIDDHIAQLKTALAAGGLDSVSVPAARLVQNNRQGRKLMQSYFKKRGVVIVFT